MEQSVTIPAAAPAAGRARPRGLWAGLMLRLRAARRDALAARARRVVLILVLLWVVGIFDLTFTLLADELGHFREANPVARPIVGNRGALVAFKITMLVCASSIFFALRRHVWAEVGCWLVAGVYTALAFVWLTYYAIHPPTH